MDRLIRPVDGGWKDDGAAASAIAAWEQQSGLKLPDDYRVFMLRYNGGKPYPLAFMHTARDADGFENPSEHYLDPFHDWARVVSWSNELGNRLPPRSLSIGADPGLIEIVLSLREEDFGAVYSWVRNRGVWGSDDNNYLCAQAPSFRAFVESLTDDASRSGYSYWGQPAGKHLERTLVV